MKIKIYILTYNNSHHLNSGLASMLAGNQLADSALRNSDITLDIYVINNHTNFHLNDEFKSKVNVIHNILQPDFGTGHSTRNWNQALIHGFKNLKSPDADYVICAQDDTEYGPYWLNVLLEAHKYFDFIACGNGDNLCSYTAEAVRRIGLWDERFCVLNYGEHDYFLRAASWWGDRSSINDTAHIHAGGLYIHNPFAEATNIAVRPTDNQEQIEQLRTVRHLNYAYICQDLFIAKWGVVPERMPIRNYVNTKLIPLIPSYITYPYFEKDIYELNEKGYNYGTPRVC